MYYMYIFIYFILFFFFFKQKTAYEIVSRDWSSDVCSSDLTVISNLPMTCNYAFFFVSFSNIHSIYCEGPVGDLGLVYCLELGAKDDPIESLALL